MTTRKKKESATKHPDGRRRRVHEYSMLELVELVRKNGKFNVSWRFCDIDLRKKLHLLVNRRLLLKVPSAPGFDSFIARS